MNRELFDIVVSWLIISLCFSISSIFYNFSQFPMIFLICAGTAGIGFLFHEIAHKISAERSGYRAYYKIWPLGVIMALAISILSKGSFVFAALGAVYIIPIFMQGEKQSYGKIALSGPFMNLLLAFIFLIMSNWMRILYIGYEINAWLAAFNLIPFHPLDGSKVFAWSKLIWLIFAAISWIMVFLS
ncbi:MAG: hypothetical protein NZ922_00850 [Candidatus Methanomethyliaceae archaeon]|nr:hypothetical protein [Candidatus Methanomethyliaceae archaeon]MDW7970273.1 site-2 protease family protein [Nitrososphaerota archaeon]